MTSSGGSPRPTIRSAAVVTVDRSTLSSLTGPAGGRSKAARKPRGLSRPMSFKVASNVIATECSCLSRLLAVRRDEDFEDGPGHVHAPGREDLVSLCPDGIALDH